MSFTNASNNRIMRCIINAVTGLAAPLICPLPEDTGIKNHRYTIGRDNMKSMPRRRLRLICASLWLILNFFVFDQTLTRAGTLDPSFGTGGTATVHIAQYSNPSGSLPAIHRHLVYLDQSGHQLWRGAILSGYRYSGACGLQRRRHDGCRRLASLHAHLVHPRRRYRHRERSAVGREHRHACAGALNHYRDAKAGGSIKAEE